MINKKKIINIKLILILCFCVIASSVLYNLSVNHWYRYNETYLEMLKNISSDDFYYSHYLDEANDYYFDCICLTISIVFSTIAAIASAIAFVLINFKFGNKDTDKKSF